MDQGIAHKFSSECGSIVVYVNDNTQLGKIHDFLVPLLSNIVERMQSEEAKRVEMMKKQHELQAEEEKKQEESK